MFKSTTRDMFQSSMLKFSPFDCTDTNYLSHLAEQLNLRKAREASIVLMPSSLKIRLALEVH